MIVINIQGGLGNQMFQYAFAKALSWRNQVDIKFDLGSFARYAGLPAYTPRPYELDKVFGIQEKEYTIEDRNTLLPDSPLYKVKRLIERKILPANKQVYIAEGNSGYRGDLLHIKHNCYLDGYWQSELYFKDYNEEVKKLFVLRYLSDSTLNWKRTIENEQVSVSIHVRRGDYVSNPEIAKIHGVCDKEYYERAIAFLEQKLQKPLSLFFFSDDIAWVKENMHFNGHQHTYVQLDNVPAAEEMYLMSQCQHNIIANSSFSWWGGWLNTNPNKTVVAPQRWFAGGAYINNTEFIIPKSWSKV
jgi:hypothetical protein